MNYLSATVNERLKAMLEAGKRSGPIAIELGICKETVRKMRRKMEQAYAAQGKPFLCECGRPQGHFGLCDYTQQFTAVSDPKRYQQAVDLLVQGHQLRYVERATKLCDQAVHTIRNQLVAVDPSLKCKCGLALGHRGPCVGVPRGPYRNSKKRVKRKSP